MAINGQTSNFPAQVDDWGEEFVNDIQQVFYSARWNKIQDAVYNLERHTSRLLLAGTAADPSETGAARPLALYKVFQITLTGNKSDVKRATIADPLFTSAEKALFGGHPLSSSNNILMAVRKAVPDNSHGYAVGLVPGTLDDSGDSGMVVEVAHSCPARHRRVFAGSYILSLRIGK